MESQDSATLWLFKIWPTIEANKNRFIGGAVAVILIIFLGFFLSWQHDQKEINAGQAFSQLMVSLQPGQSPAQLADAYLKIANDYSGTGAAQRALLQGATDLFAAGNYADAQTQFQKFADTYPASTMLGAALLGVAASLDAQGKTDAALDAYKKVIDNNSDPISQLSTKFALGRIYEQQGKLSEALSAYQEVARSSPPNSPLGQQALLKAVELRAAIPAKPMVSPVAPAASGMTLPLTTPSK